MRVAFLMLCLAACLCCAEAEADETLPELLDLYKSYELPLPPKDARLERVTERAGSVNFVPTFQHTLHFISQRDDKPVVWVGVGAAEMPSGATHGPAEPTPASLKGTQQQSQSTWGAQFYTFPELAFAIQCHAFGHKDLARAVLQRTLTHHEHFHFEQRPERPRDHRLAIQLLAWNYWCNQFASAPGDRQPIYERLIGLYDAAPGLNTKARTNVLADMKATLAPSTAEKDSVEAAIDALVDLGRGIEAEGGACAAVSHSIERDPNYRKLRDMGLDAVPALLEHTHDFRMTRCVSTSRRGVWHARIADIVLLLLNKLGTEEFAHDFLIRSGRGRAVDRGHVLHWWASARGGNSLNYLRRNAIVDDPSGKAAANEGVLHVLGRQFPEAFVEIYQANADQEDMAYVLFSTLRTSRVEPPVKTRLLLDAMKGESTVIRSLALEQLLANKHAQASSLLIAELKRIPKTPKVAYWLSTAGRIARLARLSDDKAVWDAMLRNAKRVDMGQRLEMMQAACGNTTAKDRTLAFLTALLVDKESRSLSRPDPQKLFDEAQGKDIKVDLYEGPSAGFGFEHLTVRDFAALQIAYLLEMDVSAGNDWKEADWAKLRERVESALAEREKARSGDDK